MSGGTFPPLIPTALGDESLFYPGKINRHFNAEVSRSLPVSNVLALFQKTGSVRFQVSNNTITVTP